MKKPTLRTLRLTPRQERFAQEVAAGKTATTAYKEIYGVSERQAQANSTRLINKPHIRKRIAEIQSTHAVANAVTVQTITKMLREAYSLAIETKQPVPLPITSPRSMGSSPRRAKSTPPCAVRLFLLIVLISCRKKTGWRSSARAQATVRAPTLIPISTRQSISSVQGSEPQVSCPSAFGPFQLSVM